MTSISPCPEVRNEVMGKILSLPLRKKAEVVESGPTGKRQPQAPSSCGGISPAAEHLGQFCEIQAVGSPAH